MEIPLTAPGTVQGRDQTTGVSKEETEKTGPRAEKISNQHSNPVKTKWIEARSSLNAALAGDASVEAHGQDLADALRGDTRLSVKERFELAALSESVRSRKFFTDEERLRDERVAGAKRLIRDFPGEAGGYEALLREAENEPDSAKSLALAREVTQLPSSGPVKLAAQRFIDRQALIGKSLHRIARETLQKGNSIEPLAGRGIVLYAWATWAPGSASRARKLPGLVTSRTALVGVNLDTDVSAARTYAARENLPGEMIYDERGLNAPFVEALKLGASMPIYVIDRGGDIRDVSAERGELSSRLVSADR